MRTAINSSHLPTVCREGANWRKPCSAHKLISCILREPQPLAPWQA